MYTLANQVTVKVLNFSLPKFIMFGARLLIVSTTNIFCILLVLNSTWGCEVKRFCRFLLKRKTKSEYFYFVWLWSHGWASLVGCHFALSYFFPPEPWSQFLLHQMKAVFPEGSARENIQCLGVQMGNTTCSALAKKSQLSSITAHSNASTPNSGGFSALLGFSSTTGFFWTKCEHITVFLSN